jgi:hypothetical protein
LDNGVTFDDRAIGGTTRGHVDLEANIFTNPGDPFDDTKTDDDQNGLANDLRG